MKKILTSLFVASSVVLWGQISLDINDFGVPGDQVVGARDTLLNGIFPGSAGVNQTWDFSSFVIQSYNYNLFNNVPPQFAFGGANVVYSSSNFDAIIRANSDEVTIVGLDGDVGAILGGDPVGISLSVPFIDGQKVIEFPANYGDTFLDTTHFDKKIRGSDFNIPPSIADSVRVIHRSTATNEMDAHGTLILLNDTQQVLRKKRIEYFVDTILIKTSQGVWAMIPSFPPYFETNPRLDTLVSYEYYTKGRKYIMATINTSFDGEIRDATFLADSMLIAQVTTSPLLCNGNNDGQAIVNVTDLGTPPYNYQWSNGSTADTAGSLSAGQVFVTVTDVDGKMGIGFNDVNEPLPFQVNDSVVNAFCQNCSDGQVYLTPSGGASPYTFSWAGSPSSGAFLDNLSVGTYAYTVTDANGCEVSSSADVSYQPVGIELNKVSAFDVYPNPTNKALFIDLDQFAIYNILGEEILRKNVHQKQEAIDVSWLPKGNYLIVDTKQAGSVQKLVVY